MEAPQILWLQLIGQSSMLKPTIPKPVMFGKTNQELIVMPTTTESTMTLGMNEQPIALG